MDNDTQFLLFILMVFVFFGFLINFLLNYRKKTLSDNLSLTSSDAWNSIKPYATPLALERSNLIYAIYQDENDWEGAIIIRNGLDQNIAKTVLPLIKRQKILTFGNENYVITHLLAFKRVIIFQKQGADEILAKWSENGWFGKHKVEIPNIGTIVSSRISLDSKVRHTYSFEGKIVGIKENTFNSYPIGRVAILPELIPDCIRAFILSI